VPNRIVREGIITSESVNALTWAEEVFYRRLHSVVDDYGRFSANLSLLRAACYPLRLNDVSDRDVGKWLAVCATKALVTVYQVDGKRYLEVQKFGQRARAEKSRYPPPPSDGQPLANGSPSDDQLAANCLSSAPVVVVEVEDEDEGVCDKAAARKNRSHVLPDGFEIFWNAYPKRAGNNPTETAVKCYRARIAEGHTAQEIFDGAVRYARFCRLTGKEGTEYVLQAKTFLGPQKPFKQSWDGPSGAVPDYSEVMARIKD
jgi:hypothetical protein